jgi:uncharacterized lipoprotein YajG
MRSLIILFCGAVSFLLSGCGIAPISLRYNPTGNYRVATTSSVKVALQIQDLREKKIFFRTILGDNDDEGKNGVLRLQRCPREIFEEGFTEALQKAGCQVLTGSPVVMNVEIKRFLAIDRENNTNTIKSDIVLDVSVKHQDKILVRKTIWETDTRKEGFGQVWQDVVPPILNDSLSRAIEKTVWDPDVLLAIEQGNGLNTTMADIPARLKISPPTIPTVPPAPVAKSETATPTQTDKTSHQTTSSPVSRSGSSPFRSSYIQGLGPPEVHIQNQSDKTITVSLTGLEEYSVDLLPHGSIKKVLKAGTYQYHASAFGVSPTSGTETFMTDHRYTWTFMIVSYPSIPNIRIPSR